MNDDFALFTTTTTVYVTPYDPRIEADTKPYRGTKAAMLKRARNILEHDWLTHTRLVELDAYDPAIIADDRALVARGYVSDALVFIRKEYGHTELAEWPERGAIAGKLLFCNPLALVVDTPRGPLLESFDDVDRNYFGITDFELHLDDKWDRLKLKQYVGKYIGIQLVHLGRNEALSDDYMEIYAFPYAKTANEARVLTEAARSQRTSTSDDILTIPEPTKPETVRIAAIGAEECAVRTAAGELFATANVNIVDQPGPRLAIGDLVSFRPTIGLDGHPEFSPDFLPEPEKTTRLRRSR